ncbi:GNAT family N-acetyltransferase [Halomonas eurihalina]|uniref:GNAT family N-acetyltransferase n=1 Tax=Halomonas eurihalina TaxID=42566 RepID=A0A5D9D9E8_HALER|nr:GNAT family N-acetyltransferase [Halomonas eurihalina]MDR5859461.1 GNAT family N-acetyltransferase [Halomonas eurihalina]TZG40504.1 GNAT family N-acetyltransferase [Halomonas eurihalina]
MLAWSLVPARAGDEAWAAALVADNMASADRRHGIDWCRARFTDDWEIGENYLLWLGKERIGYLRLWQAEDRSYLQDMQVVAEYRGRGWGNLMLDEVKAMAWSRGAHAIRLKVFEDSPALQLYWRHGFEALMHEPPLIGMEWSRLR